MCESCTSTRSSKEYRNTLPLGIRMKVFGNFFPFSTSIQLIKQNYMWLHSEICGVSFPVVLFVPCEPHKRYMAKHDQHTQWAGSASKHHKAFPYQVTAWNPRWATELKAEHTADQLQFCWQQRQPGQYLPLMNLIEQKRWGESWKDDWQRNEGKIKMCYLTAYYELMTSLRLSTLSTSAVWWYIVKRYSIIRKCYAIKLQMTSQKSSF